METMQLTAKDGLGISVAIYTVDDPIGVVQIIHGSKEHKGRYADFCRYLQLVMTGTVNYVYGVRMAEMYGRLLTRLRGKDGDSLLIRLLKKSGRRSYVMGKCK